MISEVRECFWTLASVGDCEGELSVAVDNRRHKSLLLSLVCYLMDDISLDRLGADGVQFLESQNRPV
jgi:hypothetical protein